MFAHSTMLFAHPTMFTRGWHRTRADTQVCPYKNNNNDDDNNDDDNNDDDNDDNNDTPDPYGGKYCRPLHFFLVFFW